MNFLTRAERQAFYNSPEWKALRLYILQQEPFCRNCMTQGTLKTAKVVDHITDIKDSPEGRLEPKNLQPLCSQCHSIKTFKGKVPHNKRAAATEMIRRMWKI